MCVIFLYMKYKKQESMRYRQKKCSHLKIETAFERQADYKTDGANVLFLFGRGR